MYKYTNLKKASHKQKFNCFDLYNFLYCKIVFEIAIDTKKLLPLNIVSKSFVGFTRSICYTFWECISFGEKR